jgi:DNA polymerase I-like protein with 3'-5' exonuclease and polymerase domains
VRLPKPTTVDFETPNGLSKRPEYPPIPCGVSIKHWGKKPKYYAWGHIAENNCTWEDAKRALHEAWRTPDGVLCQNGKFDVDVAEVHFEVPRLEWHRYHDTLYLLFLDDPHQIELGLKPAAERLLDLAPDEREEVADWLIAKQPVPNIRISKSKQSDHYYMAYLGFAPGKLVGKYADGDSIRTEAIFKLLWEKTMSREMSEGYDRERRLMVHLLDIERQGIPVDLPRLESDIKHYRQVHDKLSDWVRKQLKSPELNIQSGKELAEALLKAKKADPNLLGYTAKGGIQTNKEALKRGVTDPTIGAALRYLAQLSTCLGTFMENWYETARLSDGLIYTTWNQTKSTDSGSAVGARTGRLSSTPNFQNIPKEFEALWYTKGDPKTAKHPKAPMVLPALPLCRGYIVPWSKDEVLLDRDYSQQEPRILAHFDGGSLLQAYLGEPWIDFHDFAKAELEKMGLFYDRKPVKNTNLGLIYGMGVGKLAEKNGMSVEEAGELKKAVLKLYPGLKQMYQEMRRRAKANEPIRTWGSREYYCEPPKLVEGRIREFDYKLVNLLIQGSAADCTKEAMIRFMETKKDYHRLFLTVHDEILTSAPLKAHKDAMLVLKESMESIEFDVPMLSEGSWSKKNWAELVNYDVKGKFCYAN